MWKGKKPEKALKITYFGHFYVHLGPNLKRLFSVFIILGNQYRPQTITWERSGSQPEKATPNWTNPI